MKFEEKSKSDVNFCDEPNIRRIYSVSGSLIHGSRNSAKYNKKYGEFCVPCNSTHTVSQKSIVLYIIAQVTSDFAVARNTRFPAVEDRW